MTSKENIQLPVLTLTTGDIYVKPKFHCWTKHYMGPRGKNLPNDSLSTLMRNGFEFNNGWKQDSSFFGPDSLSDYSRIKLQYTV